MMRVSARKNDPGFMDTYIDWQVYLDGRLINDCFTADEELGEAHCYKKNRDGDYILTPDGDEVESEIMYGKVRIKKKRF